jgi:hypothetical protein
LSTWPSASVSAKRGWMSTTCAPAGADGGIDVLGHFPAPPGPDWGWRTVIEASGDDAFRLAMYTIEPEGGEETLGFENRYTRAP